MSTSSSTAETIDLTAYCNDPSKFVKQPEHVRYYYDNLCKTVDQMRAENNKSSEGGAAAGKALGQFVTDLPYMLTVGMFSDPSNLTLFFMTDALELTKPFWDKHAAKVFANASKHMAQWGYNWIARFAQAPGLSRFLVNATALTRSMLYGVNVTVNLTTGMVRNTVRAFLALVGSRAFIASMQILVSLMSALSVVFAVQMVVQITSMIIDAADPCDLNKALDADSMVSMTQEMDRSFKEQILAPESVLVTPDQEIHYINQWPIDIRVEKLFPQRLRNSIENEPLKKARYEEFGMDNDRAAQLEDLHAEYLYYYLGNLRYNAYGQPISFPEKYDPPNVNPKMMEEMGQKFVSLFANNNPVVARWIDKFAPLLLAGIVLILFLIFRYV